MRQLRSTTLLLIAAATLLAFAALALFAPEPARAAESAPIGIRQATKLSATTTPGAPSALALASANRELAATWTAPADDGGAAITNYDVEYRVAGSNTWTQAWTGSFDSGTLGGSDKSSRDDPLDFGQVEGLGIPVIRENSGGWGVYKLGAAVDELRIRAGARGNWNVPGTRLKARYHTSKPGGSGICDAGTELWAVGGQHYNGDGTITAGLSSGSYFWVCESLFSQGGGLDFSGRYLRLYARFDATTTARAIVELENGTSYEVRVRAENEVGAGAWSASVTMRAGAPDAPNAPTLVSGNSALAASWDAPNQGGAAIADYDVRYKQTAVSVWKYMPDTASSTARSATIDNLTNGISYDVQVRAGNSIGDGGWSPSAALKAGAPSAPAAPTLVSGNARLTVTWTAPADSGSPITDYDLRYSSNNGSSWTETDDTTPSTSTTATITSLTNGTTYQVQVRAGNANEDGAWSPSATLKAGLPAAPPAPALVSGNRTLKVTATAPADNGGSGVTGFRARYRQSGASNWTTHSTTLTGSPASVTIGGLTNGTEYEVQVAARNQHDYGPWSPTAKLTPGAPDAPSAPTLASGNARLTASWDAPNQGGGAITDYDVRYKQTSASTWTYLPDATPSTSTTATITPLTNGTSYDVQVRAGNSTGDGGWSPSATLRAGVPAAPSAPTLDSGNARLTVTWTAPANNGSAITDYDLRYSSNNGTSWTETADITPSVATTTTITPLTNGTSYDVQVRAGNARGDGPWSPSATLKAGLPAAPPAPTLDSGNGALTVTATAPADNGGSSVTGFRARYRQSGASTWTAHSSTMTGAPASTTISTLTNGVTYEVQVAATNQHGYGPWSPSATHKVGLPSAPAAPTLVTGNGTLAVSWNAPDYGGSGINDYDVRHKRSSEASWGWRYLPDDTLSALLSATIGSLTNGTSYDVQVRAGTAHGNGPWSPSATIEAGGPSAPSAPTLVSGNARLTVSWNAPVDSGSAITDYDLRYKKTASSTWAYLPDTTPSTSTTATITTLTNGAAYQVQVRAGNARGDGAWSPSATLKAGLPAAPSAPTLVSGNGTLKVTATAPADNGGSGVTGFRAQYRQSGASAWTAHSSTMTGAPASTTISALTNGAEYEVQVAATNQHGYGAWSPSATLKAGLPAAPDAPALASGNAKLTASWAAPSDNGGSGVQDYDVRYRRTGTTAWTTHTHDATTTWAPGTTGGTQSVHGPGGQGLNIGQPTGLGVTIARETLSNVAGIYKLNGPVAKLRVQLSATALDTTGLVYVTARYATSKPGGSNLHTQGTAIWTVDLDDSQSLNVTFSADGWTGYLPSGSYFWITTSYNSNVSNFTPRIELEVQSGSLSRAVEQLTNGANYDVQVRASNSAGEGPWSGTSAHKAGLPETPAAPTVTPGNGSVSVSWPAPSGNGSSITDYDVRYSSNNGTSWTELNANSTSTQTTATISPATNGTTYLVQVRAANAVGESGWSPSGSATAGLPATIGAVTLTPSSGQLVASWTAPADAGSPILYYELEYRQGAAGLWTRLPLGYWDSGTQSNTNIGTDQNKPADLQHLGDAALGLTLTRETAGNGKVYKITEAVGSSGLRVQWDVTFSEKPADFSTISTNKTKPTPNISHKGNTIDHALPLPGITSYSLDGNTGALSAGSYIWMQTRSADEETITSWRVRLTDVATYAHATTTSRTLTGLTNNQSYQVRARAVNARGNGEWSAVATRAPGVVPGKTGNVLALPTSAEKASARSVIVHWNKANPENSTTGYDIEWRYRPLAGGAWSSWTVATTTNTAYNKPITLDAGYNREYQFRVRARNNVGYGAYSGVETVEIDVAPGQVAAPTVTKTSDGLRVSWDAPTNRGSPVTEYRVEYKKASEGDDKWQTAYDGQAVVYTAASKFFQAGDPLDMGQISDIAGVSLTREKTGPPLHIAKDGVYKTGSALSELRVRLRANRYQLIDVSAHWNETKPNTGGLFATGIKKIWEDSRSGGNSVNGDGVATDVPANSYFWISASGAPSVTLDNVTVTLDVLKPSTSTSRTLTGLTDGTAYDVRVWAENAYGKGATSTAASGTPGLEPGAPAAPTLEPGDRQLAVTWAEPSVLGSGEISDYDVRYKVASSTTWTEWNAANNSTSTTATITGLTNGTEYDVQARAANAVGDGAWSATSTLKAGVPKTPNAPGVAPGNGSISASWSAPNGNGANLTGYGVRYRETGTTTWSVHTHTGTGVSATISSGVTNGKEYEVQVRGVNSRGNGKWSPSGKAVAGAPSAPSAPTLANTTAGGQLSASWNAPGSANGSDVTGYDVRYRESATTTWKSHTHTGTSTQTTISGLTNTKTYHVRLRARNANGAGPWAESSKAVGAVPTKTTITTLALGTRYSADRALDIRWTASANNPTGYELWWRYRTDGGNWNNWYKFVTLTSPSVSASGYYKTTYEMRVLGTNNYGRGPFSDVASIYVDTEPDKVGPITVTATNQTLFVDWNAPGVKGSPISDYRVEYQQTTPSNSPWQVPFDRQKTVGPLSTAKTVNGAGGVPLDLGEISGITGVTITRESVGANAGVYKISSALGALRLRLTGTQADAGSVSARWAATKPTATTLNTHGAEISKDDSGTALSLDGRALSLPANAYFWITSAASESVSSARLTLDLLLPSLTTERTLSGLTNDTAYNVRVSAVNTLGAGTASDVVTATPRAQPPAAPAAPTLTAGNGQLSASWNAPATNGAAIDDYDLRYKIATSTTWTETADTASSTATSSAITGLDNGRTYNVQVRAGSAAGDGPWSPSATGTPVANKPGAPSAPTLVTGNASLSVSWNAPADDGGADITAYFVQYSTDQVNWSSSNVTVDFAARTATITGLTNGTNYHVAVAARNSSGTGLYSSSSARKAGLPGKVTGLTLSPGTKTLDVTWDAPSGNGSPITGYEVQWATNQAFWDRFPHRNTNTYTTVLGLSTNVRHYVRVRAESQLGSGEYSEIVSMKPGVPVAPAAPTLTIGNGQLGVAWNEPANNGAAITDYDVRYRESATTTWKDVPDNGSNTTRTVTLTNLTNGTPYLVQVRAANSRDEGPWSLSSRAVPGVPETMPAPALEPGGTSITARWAAVQDATGYKARHSSDGSNWTTKTVSGGSTTSATISGLATTTEYQVQVLATNAQGDGLWSPSARLKPGLPAKTATPTLTPGNTQLAALWTATTNNGSAITDYDVRYKESATTTWKEWDANATSTTPSVTITGLTNGTAYDVQARATNAVGDGAWSDTATGTPATTPSAPSAPTLTAGASASMTAGWSAPSSDGGSPVTAYEVRYSSDSGANWSSANVTVNFAARTATITGLAGGSSYVAQVRAVNARGNGAWSASSASLTLASTPNAPAAPTLTTGDRSLAVKWAAPTDGGSAITDYDVRYKATTANTWSETPDNTPGTTLSTTIGSLTNGTEYQVQVRAGNDQGDGAWSATSSLKAGLPAIVTGLNLTPGSARITAQWTAPSGNGSALTGYDVQRCSTGCDTNANWTDVTHSGTNATVTITNLDNNTSYRVRVRAENQHGEGEWAVSDPLNAGAPQQVSRPTVVSGNGSITVSWTAPADNGSAISAYTVRYSSDNGATWTTYTGGGSGSASGSSGASISSGANSASVATTITITGLQNGTTYLVQVQATNGNGNSVWSQSSSSLKAGLPGKVTGLTLTPGNTLLNASWTAPPDNGSPLAYYKVEFARVGGGYTGIVHNSTSTTAEVRGIDNGVRYNVRVAARNQHGIGPWSEAVAMLVGAPEAPAAPTLTRGNRQIAVSWSAPNDNGSGITDYDVRYSSDDGANWTETDDSTPSTATTATIINLTNGTEYQVQVRAANTHGDGPWSVSATSTPAAAPATPSAPTLTPGDRSLAVSWTAPANNGSAITDYDVRYSTDGSNWTETPDNTPSAATSTTIGSLTNDTEYQVQVRATNAVGDSSWSPSARATPAAPVTTPAAPAAPTLTAGDRSLAVSWSAPNDGGSAITDYDVRYSTDGSNWTEWNANATSTATSTTITGLTNGTEYQVQVRAGNAVGDSAWSASATSTPAAAPATPSAPTLTPGDRSLAVSWTAPANNGSAITDYDVRYSTDGSNWTETPDNTPSAATSTTIGSLTNDTEYQVQVRATNAVGNSSWSASARATPAAPATAPSAPSAPTLTAGDRSLAVSWSAPNDGGSAITDYDVRYSSDGGNTWTEWNANNTGTNRTATITNLTEGTEYQVQVRAANTHGDGPWSESASATPGPPSEPVDVWVDPKNNAFEVSWLEPVTPRGAIVDYDIRYRAVGTTGWSEWPGTSTARVVQVTGVNNGTLYEVQVRADNQNGPGPWTASVQRDPGAPARPIRPRLDDSNDGLRVRSMHTTADHGSPITDYDMRYSIDLGKTWTEFDPAATSTTPDWTITPFMHAATYWVQIRAQNARGLGPWSTWTLRKHLSDFDTLWCDPNAVTTMGVGQYCEIMVGVDGVESWDGIPMDEQDSRLLIKYREGIHRVHNKLFAQFVAYNPAGGTTTIETMNALPRGTVVNSFDIEVRPFAIKQVKMTPETPAANSAFELLVTLDSPMSQIPDKLKYPHGTSTVLYRSWVELELPQGWTATSDPDLASRFTNPVQIVPQYGNWVKFTVTTGSVTGNVSFTIKAEAPFPVRNCETQGNPLTDKSCYPSDEQTRQVTVSASSQMSASVTAQAGQTPAPPAPVAPTLTAGQGELSVSWTPPASPSSPITAYEVQYRHHPDGAWTTWASLGADARSTTITGLTPGGIYRVRARAQNGFGWGGYTNPYVEVTLPTSQPPPAVTGLTASRDGDAINVSWNASDGATGYDLEYSIDARQSWTRAATNHATTTYTLANTDAANSYVIAVRAVNSGGESGWTNSEPVPSEQTTKPTPPPTPQPPAGVTGLTASRDGNAISVSWNASDGATGYDVVYSTDAKRSWTRAATDHAATTYTLANADAAKSYVLAVRAVNSAGESGWTNSAPVPAQQPTIPTPPATSQPPAAVANVVAVHTGKNVSALWRASDGATGYDLEYSTDGGASWTRAATNHGIGIYILDGADAAKTYLVRVRAVNSNGESGWTTAPPAKPLDLGGRVGI